MCRINRYRAVLCDIDGTLLDHNHALSVKTVNAFRALHARHVEIALATGRMPGGVTHIVQDLGVPCHLILYSGAYVLSSKGQRVVSHRLSKNDALRCICHTEMAWPDVSPSYFVEGEWYASDTEADNIKRESAIVNSSPVKADLQSLVLNGELPNKIFFGCSGQGNVGKQVGRDLMSLGLEDARVIVSTSGSLVEVVPKSVTKATGAMSLLGFLGIDICEAVAFGDDMNDLEMLEHAGLGVAVGNASPEVQKHADAVAPRNDEDGVASFIMRSIAEGLFD